MSKHPYERIAMACQGGGSLGAYHIGALQAMEENGYSPDMVAGISIGAFTASIIAGNPPAKRIEKLEKFWNTISWPELDPMGISNLMPELRKLHNKMSTLMGYVFGQPNFFVPRFPAPQFQPKGTPAATSYYDTSKMIETLREFVDYDGINSGKLGRLLLGATRVTDGELVFFDSAEMKIGPEHTLASGAFPPGFPGSRINGELYWDGGCSSNTPLEGIFNAKPKKNTLVFMVDLFGPNGKEPKDMEDVDHINKELQFASRTAHHIGHIQNRHNLGKAVHHLFEALKKASPDSEKDPILKELKEFASDSLFDVVHISYDKLETEVQTSDCEFSRLSIKDRRDQGYKDMKAALSHAAWLKGDRKVHQGSKVHRYVGEKHHSSK